MANKPAFPAKRTSNLSRIKMNFVSSILQRDAERIRAEQEQVASDWNLYESGKLKSMLRGHFSINATTDGGSLSMRHLVYARFLDMSTGRSRVIRQARREGYHLYNRILFGNLYNRTLPGLKYGFTEQVQDDIQRALDGAMSGESDADRLYQSLIIKKLRK